MANLLSPCSTQARPASKPFAPYLTAAPNDFSLGLLFTGGGINQTIGMAVDAMDNVWSTNAQVSKVSAKGAVLSGTGYVGGGIEAGGGGTSIALDGDGNA